MALPLAGTGSRCSVSLQFRTIHGYRRGFRVAGSGPALLLFHGVGADSATWEPVHAKLAQRFTVIAPDLLGHAQLRSDWACAAGPPCARYIRSVSSYIPYVSIEGTGLE